MKCIFEYDNYRLYLKDSYQFLKSKNKNFSFRFFSRKAGFKSPNFLKKAIDGQVNLSLTSISKFASALGLNKEESDFFKNLVLLNQAQTAEEKQNFAEEILRSRTYRKIHPLGKLQYKYFSQWFYIPVREVVGLAEFKDDPVWVANAVMPKITPAEAQKALQDLTEMGLLKRNDQGRLVQSNTFIATPSEVTSAAVATYHKEMMKRASEAIDGVVRSERDISAVAFPIPKKAIAQVKEMVEAFRKQLFELAEKEGDADSIYQLNLQLFPVAQAAKKVLP